MAAQAYLALDGGIKKEIAFTQTSNGAEDAGKGIALGDDGNLHSSLFPSGMGDETILATASEALEAGNFVNIYDDSGMKCRKADATGPGEGKKAHGFVLEAVNSGNPATVYVGGVNNQLTGLAVGSTYYLSKTAGGVVSDVSSYTTGNIVQEIGVATSATALVVQFQKAIEKA